MQGLLDSDIAEIYAVETKRINEAVKNNPDKFPEGYLIELAEAEWLPLRSKISTSMKGGRIYKPKVFTEKALYMLLTILKSPKSPQATLQIVETFTRLSELNRAIATIHDLPENSAKQKHYWLKQLN